jgi:F420H(2)-dependent quinone reductase
MAVSLPPNGTYGTKPPVPKLLVRVFLAINVALYPLIGRRIRMGEGRMCVIETSGARTGRRRRTPLVGFLEDSGTWLLIASNGGAQRHPQWVRNLARNPNANLEVEGQRMKVEAESLEGDERERTWSWLMQKAPLYGRYQEKTDRRIPLIRLTPSA